MGEDGKFIKYDFLVNKFVLDTVNNFPETPNDNINYVWKTEFGVGAWRSLEDTKEITDINTEQITQNNRLDALEA